MAFSTYWSKGIFRQDGSVVSDNALGGFETELNKADGEQLREFLTKLKNGHSVISSRKGLPDSTSSDFHSWIDEAWFGSGGKPMWFVDSELSPDEIHEIMRLTAATLAEMLLAEPELTIEMYCRCAYTRFRTEISRPFNQENLLRVWIFGPYNMASAQDIDPESWLAAYPLAEAEIDDGTKLPPDEAQRRFDRLIAEVGSEDPTRAHRERALTIARRWDELGRPVYIGTPFARNMMRSQTGLPVASGPEVKNEIEVVKPPNPGSGDLTERRGQTAAI